MRKVKAPHLESVDANSLGDGEQIICV